MKKFGLIILVFFIIASYAGGAIFAVKAVKERDTTIETQSETITQLTDENSKLKLTNENILQMYETSQTNLLAKETECAMVTEHKELLLSCVSTIDNTVNAVETETTMETLEATKTNVLAKYSELNATIENLENSNSEHENTIATMSIAQQILLECITAIDNKINSTSDTTTLTNVENKKQSILDAIDVLNATIADLQAQVDALTAEKANWEYAVQRAENVTVEYQNTSVRLVSGDYEIYSNEMPRPKDTVANLIAMRDKFINEELTIKYFNTFDRYLVTVDEREKNYIVGPRTEIQVLASDNKIKFGKITYSGVENPNLTLEDFNQDTVVSYYYSIDYEIDLTTNKVSNVIVSINLVPTEAIVTYYRMADGLSYLKVFNGDNVLEYDINDEMPFGPSFSPSSSSMILSVQAVNEGYISKSEIILAIVEEWTGTRYVGIGQVGGFISTVNFNSCQLLTYEDEIYTISDGKYVADNGNYYEISGNKILEYSLGTSTTPTQSLVAVDGNNLILAHSTTEYNLMKITSSATFEDANGNVYTLVSE